MPLFSRVTLLLTGVLVCAVQVGSASARLPIPARHHSNNGHAARLVQAERDLLAAEAALVAGNRTGAHQAISAAEKQVHQAIGHHSNVVAKFPRGNGFTGLIVRTRHHGHHNLLTQAQHHLQAAQKSINANNGVAALEHVELGGRMIKASLQSHNRLFP
jgi:hypothetical protein